MIEIVSESRCVSCNRCVSVCPTNVFDSVEGGVPVIARQDDCQTCFMCELYCPVDALYVAPDSEGITGVTEEELEREGLFGGYREKVGWGKGARYLSPSTIICINYRLDRDSDPPFREGGQAGNGDKSNHSFGTV